MILKFFEIDKIDLVSNKFFLFYGENAGHIRETIEKKFIQSFKDETYRYDENEILNNKDDFFNSILTNSFFEDKKLVLISRGTDKIKETIEEVLERKIFDLTIIINAGILDKKSKLRSFFEKNKETICVPFYPDNAQSLSQLVTKFFRENKKSISQEVINLIVNRAMGDRQNLKTELEKIKSFAFYKERIEINDVLKLTNLAENHGASHLVDQCLAKNKKKTVDILNENNFALEDCIIVIRTFLNKSKRLLQLSIKIKDIKNLENIISSAKPPIFWKDKEIVKQQLGRWSYKEIEGLIFKISKIELLIKKNSNNSINILSDFIIEQCSTSNN